ncbi:MAG: hypothetical protein QGH51_06415 [Planctomycetota bacterium]|nr:hypothetical protein [Planctomycetota bacterium]
MSLIIASLISAQGRSWARAGRIHKHQTLQLAERLQVELAAKSGLLLAQRRLEWDPNWVGGSYEIGKAQVRISILPLQDNIHLLAKGILGASQEVLSEIETSKESEEISKP